MGQGLIIAAPGSGCGKTTVTLGLLRLLARAGIDVRAAKSGPDYIDPKFHEAACGAPCVNLDAWSMGADRIGSLAAGDGLLVIEGAMGLFDGAPPHGKGAVADLARILDLPVILVVDASKQAGSVAALVAGFAGFDRAVRVGGVILNKVGRDRHEAMLRQALAPLNIPVLAVMRRNDTIALPSRHLGLVQAGECAELETVLERAADALEATLGRDVLERMARPLPHPRTVAGLPPPAQVIAVAKDAAFGFHYPHMLQDWRSAGAEIRFFSPLANDAVPEAGFVFLPGGYPELHAGQLAAAHRFFDSLRFASQHADIYGECGGYMTLGDGLTDAQGVRHAMAGLLRLETSFETRHLHLGYRQLTAMAGPFTGRFGGHEFHYASTVSAKGTPLFAAHDAEGTALPDMGLSDRRVYGSFAHIIDAAPQPLVVARQED